MTPRSARALALCAILVVAAALRFWRLGAMPPGLYHDEAYYGLDAQALLRGETFPIFHEAWELYAAEAHADRPPTPTRFPVFFEGNYGREPLHVYLMALSIRLFGAIPFAVRFFPALAGVLAVGMTWLAARTLWEDAPADSPRRTVAPLAAAAVLAALFPAVHFSRFGLRMMLFTPLACGAVICFWRGVRAGSPRATTLWWSAAGALIGGGLYTYAAARLFPLVFAGYAALWFWRDRAALRRYIRPFLALVGSAVLVALPLLIYFARYPYFFVFRVAYVANRGAGAVEGRPWVTWLLNVGRVVRGLFWQGETHLRHNLPGRPYLDLTQAVAFSLGLSRLARRPSDGALRFLALWLIAMLLPTILSGDAPHFGRMTGAAPVVAVWCGLGISWLCERIGRGWRRPGAAGVVAAVWLAAGVLWTARDYFGVYGRLPALATGSYPTAEGFYQPDWQLGQLLAAEPPETVAYLAPPQEEMATIFFALDGQPDRLRSYDGSAGLLPAGVPGRPALYVVRPRYARTLENLRAYYGSAWQEEQTAAWVLGRVAADAPRPTPPAPSEGAWRFGETVQLVGWSAERTADSMVVTLAWQMLGRFDAPQTAFVHLLDGDGAIVAQLDRPPAGYATRDWRPGELVIDHFAIALPEGTAVVGLRTGFYNSATLAVLGTPFSAPSAVSR